MLVYRQLVAKTSDYSSSKSDVIARNTLSDHQDECKLTGR